MRDGQFGHSTFLALQPHRDPTPNTQTMSVSPNWKEELAQNGYTVIKGAVPVERANEYVDRGLTWLEGFDYTKVNLGKDPPTKPFKRDDPSTWTYAHLPDHSLGGLFTGYACSHEDWVWQARTYVILRICESFEARWTR